MIHLISSCQKSAEQRPTHSAGVADSGDKRGFTILELLMAIAIIGILAAVAIPMYGNYKEKTKTKIAIQDIVLIQTVIDRWSVENRYAYPASLADVGMDGKVDPWNTPYQYTNVDSAKGKGSARKDRNLVPINTDYDLWSNGPDKLSTPPLTAAHSRDDIVRANNGRYVGPAADY